MREQSVRKQPGKHNQCKKQMANSGLREGIEMRDYLLMTILKHSIDICKFPSFFPSFPAGLHRGYKLVQIHQANMLYHPPTDLLDKRIEDR